MSADESSVVLEITDANMDKEVMQSELPVIVDCWAPWCGPCLMLTPTIEEIAKEQEGKIKVGKLNVDENMKTAMTYSIRSIPTILVFSKGKLVDQMVGAASKKAIVKQLEKNIELNG